MAARPLITSRSPLSDAREENGGRQGDQCNGEAVQRIGWVRAPNGSQKRSGEEGSPDADCPDADDCARVPITLRGVTGALPDMTSS